jgi:sulfatase modifying factor 1
MKTTTAFAFFSLAICYASVVQATVTFDWATVGNPGNEGEVQSQGTFGAVAHTYNISKTEVTNAQYTDFLNAVADTDTNALYSTLMDSSTRGGITRTGSSGSYTYAVKSDSIGNSPGGTDYTYGNKPVVYVSFFDAM